MRLMLECVSVCAPEIVSCIEAHAPLGNLTLNDPSQPQTRYLSVCVWRASLSGHSVLSRLTGCRAQRLKGMANRVPAQPFPHTQERERQQTLPVGRLLRDPPSRWA
mmetsp:Transcript_36698/g.72208  ORF Transcript_36698/g.72208 Transcript_36698/m.72208 type:complete len:106 (+) Transcript_36698:16-333(+)